MALRWLLVSAQHHAAQGGVGAYVERFVRAARAARWHIELITRSGDLHPPASVVHAVATPDARRDFAERLPALRRIGLVRPYRYALWSRAVRAALLELDGQYDAIEFIDCQAEGYVALTSAHLRQRFRGTPMIVHAHTPMFVEERINGADPEQFGRAIYHDWERAALRAADGVIATSDGLVRRLPPLQRVAVVPYPVQPVLDATPRQGKAHVPETILCVGSIQPRKGVDVWARSLHVVLRSRPHARAVLIGPDTATGPGGISMLEHVRALLDPSIGERFHHAGPLRHADVLSLMREAALVVVPSRFESFSFAAAEALIAGTPVIVTDQVGLLEHVPMLTNVPADDADALAQAQLRVLAKPDAARSNAMACRGQLLEACSPRRHLQLRIKFVQGVDPDSSTHELLAAEDGLTSIDRFIASVEACERGEAALSWARS